MKVPHFLLLLVFFAALGEGAVLAADWARHPRLRRAHEAIEHAKRTLNKANDGKKTEFGGHRAKALELLNQAQQEVEAAADWANSDTERRRD